MIDNMTQQAGAFATVLASYAVGGGTSGPDRRPREGFIALLGLA